MLTFLNRPVAGENAFFHLFLFSTLPDQLFMVWSLRKASKGARSCKDPSLRSG